MRPSQPKHALKCIAIGLAAVTLAGCRSAPSIIGTWDVTGPSPRSEFTVRVKFDAPNQMKWSFDSRPRPVSSEDLKDADPVERAAAAELSRMSAHGDATGTFKLDGDSIVMHWDTLKTQTSGISLKQKQMLEKYSRDEDKTSLEIFNKSGTGHIKWIDSNHFTIKEPGVDDLETFTRVK